MVMVNKSYLFKILHDKQINAIEIQVKRVLWVKCN